MSAKFLVLLGTILTLSTLAVTVDVQQCDDGNPTLSLSGGVTGDPHFTGFHGERFEFQGYANGVFRLFAAPEISMNARMTSSNTHEGGTFIGELGFVLGRSEEIFVGCVNETLTVRMNSKPVVPDHPVIVNSGSDDIALYFSHAKSLDMGEGADVTVSFGGLMASITKHKNRATSCFLNVNLGVQSGLSDLALEQPEKVIGILGDTLHTGDASAVFGGMQPQSGVNKYWDGVSTAHGNRHEVASSNLFDTPDVFESLNNVRIQDSSRSLLSDSAVFKVSSIGRHLEGATIVCDTNEECIGETCYCEPGFEPGNPHCEPCPDPCLQLVTCDGLNIWVNTCSGITSVTIRIRVIPDGGGSGGYTIEQTADIGGIGGAGISDEEFIRIMGSHHGFDWISPISFDSFTSGGGASSELLPGAPEVGRSGGGMQFIRNYTISGGGGSGSDPLDISTFQPQNGGGSSWPVDVEIQLPSGGSGSGGVDDSIELVYYGSGGGSTPTTDVLTPDGSGWYRFTVMPELYWCNFNIRWSPSTSVTTTSTISGAGAGGPSTSSSSSSPPGWGCTNVFAVNYDSTATTDDGSCSFTGTPIVATGGVVTDIDVNGTAYRVHTFSSNGAFTVTSTGSNGLVEYLVIGGGGAGGGNGGGGAGAGGYRSSVQGEMSGGGNPAEAPMQVSVQTYSVTIGTGGPYVSNYATPIDGTASVFGPIVSAGGGSGSLGGWAHEQGNDGGSGGGGGVYYSTDYSPAGQGTPGQGFRGGNAQNNGASAAWITGGGGGAGSAGQDAISLGVYFGGLGGDGVESAIDGTPTVRASGGSGYQQTAKTPGGGGATSEAGSPNTGGGGGTYGSGGSGLVIVRYPLY